MENYDNLKKLVKAIDGIVKQGEEIAADGKLSFDDADNAMAMIPHAKDIYEVAKNHPELLEDLKKWAEDKLEELKA